MSGLEKNIKNFAEAVSVMKEYQDPDICLEAAQFITSRAMADKNSAPEAIKELTLLVENEDRSIPLRRKALNEIKKIAAWHLECLPEITGNFAFLAEKEGLPMILRQEFIKIIADIAATHSKSATEAVEILTLFAGNKTTNAVLRRQAVAGLGCIAASYEKSGGLLIQKTASLLSGDPDPSLAFLGCTLISDTVPDEKCNQSFFLRAARKSFSFWKENWSLSADVAGKFYKDITEKINSIDARASLAILQKMPLPIPDEGEFLDECAAIVAKPEDDPDKILISGWIQNEEREDSKTRSAPRYEQRLAKFHKFTAV
ncbi:MAG: hypothetical protein CO093_11410 [Alphaproteobacteria bacterium CG_4_9_14_3_um_filter_47_13]|nr:MAG: hypothetical protein CO093_11410 [Alphaproteobacteria bacterium CG_4_9_14_3_um_filter_47_13]